MKIGIDKNLVEFTPDNDGEAKKLEELWKIMVDCVRFNKKLVPVGEYVSAKNSSAKFAIESEKGGSSETYAEVYADKDGSYYCQTCNKYVNLKKGERIPPCCGKLMEALD